MTNQARTLLGITGAAILMTAGAPANAHPFPDLAKMSADAMADPMACASQYLVSAVSAPGFTCQIGDKIFNTFSFGGGVPAGTFVEFGKEGDGGIFIRFMSAPGVGYGPGNNSIGYHVDVAPGAAFPDLTAVSLVTEYNIPPPSSQATGFDVRNETTGLLQSCNLSTGPGTNWCPLTSPGTEGVVRLTLAPNTPANNLVSTTNFFCENPAGCDLPGEPEHGVPEPTSLALFGLGLAGLALFARRRRS
jgi:hypothetical protein